MISDVKKFLFCCSFSKSQEVQTSSEEAQGMPPGRARLVLLARLPGRHPSAQAGWSLLTSEEAQSFPGPKPPQAQHLARLVKVLSQSLPALRHTQATVTMMSKYTTWTTQSFSSMLMTKITFQT